MRKLLIKLGIIKITMIPFTITPYKIDPYQYLLDKGIKQTKLEKTKNYVK